LAQECHDLLASKILIESRSSSYAGWMDCSQFQQGEKTNKATRWPTQLAKELPKQPVIVLEGGFGDERPMISHGSVESR
jgi:hypothetical protein